MKTLKTTERVEVLTKSGAKYSYKYTDISAIHDYLESIKASYYQYIETIDGNDYIVTVPTVDGKELSPRRGCRVVQATLQDKNNPAQEQGSALTYARRYSLLMAFGLATEDDDGESLTKVPTAPRTGSNFPRVQSYQKDGIESSVPSGSLVGGDRKPTEAQLKYIKDLGGNPEPVKTFEQASKLIENLKK